MDASINYLINVMGSEIKHGEEVLKFLFEKEKLLIANKTRAFKDMFLKEHSLFVKSRELELSRHSILETVSKKHKFKESRITLEILALKLDKEYSGKIKKIRETLKAVLHKIKNQNLKCEMLIKKSLELVTYSIGLLTGNTRNKSKMIYDKNLKADNKYLSQSILDRRG